MAENKPQPKELLVYTDAASRGNRGPASIGYLILDAEKNHIESNAKHIGDHTNNEAEYEALIWAMDRASAHCRECVTFHSDSELVVRQVNGVYRVKKDNLRPYVEKILTKRAFFKSFELVHVPRSNTYIVTVDGLVNDVLDKEGFSR